MTAEHALEVLRERGFVQQISNEQGLRAACSQPATVYCGYDPTRDSLTVGHLLSVMMLAHLQRQGHRPIALLGGGTAMVGDPTGKTEMREILPIDEIERNALGIRAQFERYLDFAGGRALMLNNADWLLELRYLPFLRDIGRHFSVNQLLQHETYRERLAGEGLNFIELNYALLQAYDYLHLHREYGCVLQIGGSDQWFNILAGVDLVRRETGHEVFALVSPLITTAAGAKMGKTEAGAIWLDPARTSPHAFYQFWINTDDRDVERFLKLFTFLPLDEIQRLGELQGSELRQAKETLAFEVTALTHGPAAAEEARAAARALFGGEGGNLEAVPATLVGQQELAAGLEVTEALIRTGLAGSRGTAKALILGGGVYVNNRRVERATDQLTEEDLHEGQILLRRGKKEYRRLVAG